MRKYRFEDSAAASDLKYWGYHKGKQCAADGYPPESTIRELLSGRTGVSGHKILCRDMPPRAWDINSRIMKLTAEQRSALFARYCVPVKETGHPYDASELATFLGVSVRTYQYWLTEARRRYKLLLFGIELQLKEA